MSSQKISTNHYCLCDVMCVTRAYIPNYTLAVSLLEYNKSRTLLVPLSHRLQQPTCWQEQPRWWTSLISKPLTLGESSYHFIHSELLLIGSTLFQHCPKSAKGSFNVLGLKSRKVSVSTSVTVKNVWWALQHGRGRAFVHRVQHFDFILISSDFKDFLVRTIIAF